MPEPIFTGRRTPKMYVKYVVQSDQGHASVEYDPNIGSFRGGPRKILKHEVISFLRKKKLPLIDDLTPDGPTSRRTSRTSRVPEEPPITAQRPRQTTSPGGHRPIPRAVAFQSSTRSLRDVPQHHFWRFVGSHRPVFRADFNAVDTSTSRTLRQFRILFRGTSKPESPAPFVRIRPYRSRVCPALTQASFADLLAPA